MNRTLAVGAVIDTPTPAAWIVDLLDRLEAHPQYDLTVIRTQAAVNTLADSGNTADGHTADITAPRRATRLGRLAQWLLTKRIDRPLFSQNPWKASVPGTYRQIIDSTKTSSVQTHCDVILNLTSGPLTGAMPFDVAAPVWCAHVETLKARVKNALLLEEPLVWTYLWAENPSTRNVQVLACHALPRQTFSLFDLQRAACFSLPALIESRLNWLANGVDVARTERDWHLNANAAVKAERDAAYARAQRLSTSGYALLPHSDLSLLRGVLALLFHQSVERIRGKFFKEQWQLAINSYADDKPRNIGRLQSTPIDHYTALKVPENRLWADPHLIEHDNKRYVFFEEIGISDKHAHLSVGRLEPSGQVSDVRTVLDDGEHLSYPFVFAHDSDHYMIPETASRRSVSLYRATVFPDQWEHIDDLLTDVNLADTTLHHDNGIWWMFCNSMSHRCVDERDELRIYFAPSITGPWQAHPMNPVVTGVDQARMAGPLICDGGKLYRISQYGAIRYGHGINVNLIDRLDQTHYRETVIARILPDEKGSWLASHTASQLRGITVIDRMSMQRR